MGILRIKRDSPYLAKHNDVKNDTQQTVTLMHKIQLGSQSQQSGQVGDHSLI